MLTEERFAKILSILESMGSVTVQQLMTELNASESTIRRDLNALDANGQLTKVHGGAILKTMAYSTKDDNVVSRKEKNRDAKNKIAKYAAEQIAPGDFVYLDAGTTTELMIEYITSHQAVFVTNAISHAKRLAKRGFTVYLLGGHRGDRRRRGSRSTGKIQFYQRLLGRKWCQPSERLFHTGVKRGDGEEKIHGKLQGTFRSGRREQVQSDLQRDVCSI